MGEFGERLELLTLNPNIFLRSWIKKLEKNHAFETQKRNEISTE